MSEYQYYEFRAVDRPLTREQMAELRSVSSRGSITPTSYVNEYHYGDFKGDSSEWMDLYFDAFLYYANWGTKTFMLKLPKSLLDESVVDEYGSEELWARTSGDSTVVTFSLQPYDGGGGWPDYDGLMADLVGLRAELADRDYRCLYLGWLINRGIGEWLLEPEIEEESPEEWLEPPVPPGLRDLTAPQRAFVEFFDIEPDLLRAAAETSPMIRQVEPQHGAAEAWIERLDPARKNEYLLRALRGDGARVGLELGSMFQAETKGSAAPPSERRRSIRELMALAREMREARLERAASEREAAKKRQLDTLLARLPQVWAEIENIANRKKANEYDGAVSLLLELRELADRGDIPDFELRVAELRASHPTKRGLLERLDRAGLPG